MDLQAAREHGVLVCTAGGANAISVAELTIFYMLYCSRNFKKVEKLYLEDYRKKLGRSSSVSSLALETTNVFHKI